MSTTHTPGPWIQKGRAIFSYYRGYKGLPIIVACTDMEDIIADTDCKESQYANAKLIAEAGTVVSETGKTPRQLADINTELLEALKWLVNVIESDELMFPDFPPYVKAKDAIQKAQQ